MHLIIDIRSRDIHDTTTTRNGQNFAKIWQKYNPHDVVSYIVSPHNNHIQNSIVVDGGVFSIFSKKKVVKHQSNQVFRMVNFSPFAPYDNSIPTLTHISSNSQALYPYGEDANYLAKKIHEWSMRYTLSHSESVIVPHISIGKELVELYTVGEEKIEIVPYIPYDITSHKPTLANPKYGNTYMIYDGGYAIEANILGLLSGWEKYKHTYGGSHKLILTGSAGDELGHITQIIRTFDLMESVIYTGTLPEEDYANLYEHASGWIYAGRYWSGGSRIEYAKNWGIPLLVSDVKALEGYSGIKIHPNHLEELPTAIKSLESIARTSSTEEQIEDYIRVYKKLLSRGGDA